VIIREAGNMRATGEPDASLFLWENARVGRCATGGQTGLGAWTDEEIAHAIRSGVAKGGRPLRLAMIWDHASNWDEEDVRAVIAFLRVLPAVHRAGPATRPPAADCEGIPSG
jgi:hypothetical protein